MTTDDLSFKDSFRLRLTSCHTDDRMRANGQTHVLGTFKSLSPQGHRYDEKGLTIFLNWWKK